MKVFENIKTSVDLLDKTAMHYIELTVIFPKANTLILDYVKKLDPGYKTKLNADDNIVFQTNVTLKQKELVINLLEFLKDLDKQYATRADVVSDFLDLLNG